MVKDTPMWALPLMFLLFGAIVTMLFVLIFISLKM